MKPPLKTLSWIPATLSGFLKWNFIARISFQFADDIKRNTMAQFHTYQRRDSSNASTFRKFAAINTMGTILKKRKLFFCSLLTSAFVNTALVLIHFEDTRCACMKSVFEEYIYSESLIILGLLVTLPHRLFFARSLGAKWNTCVYFSVKYMWISLLFSWKKRWIHAFRKSIAIMGNINSIDHDLNSARWFPFQWQNPFHQRFS